MLHPSLRERIISVFDFTSHSFDFERSARAQQKKRGTTLTAAEEKLLRLQAPCRELPPGIIQRGDPPLTQLTLRIWRVHLNCSLRVSESSMCCETAVTPGNGRNNEQWCLIKVPILTGNAYLLLHKRNSNIYLNQSLTWMQHWAIFLSSLWKYCSC